MKVKIPFTNNLFLDIPFIKGETATKSSQGLYPINHNKTAVQLLGVDNPFIDKDQDEQKLIDKGYGSNVTAFAIIKRIADAGADIPKVLYDMNNPEEPITEGDVYDMLQKPGILQGEVLTQYGFFEAVITYLLSTGNAYLLGEAPLGFGREWQRLEILPSGLTYPKVSKTSYRDPLQGFIFSDKNNKQTTYAPEDVIQTKYVNPTKYGLESHEGLSPLQASLYSLTGSNDINKAIAIMVKHQGARGILTNRSERITDDTELRILTDKVNDNIQGLQNFNRVHATGSDLNYQQIGLNANDLKIIESGVLTDRQLCNAYGVSSRLFNDPANSTYNNVKEATKGMYKNAVLPTLNKILEDLNRFWLSQYSLRDNADYKLILNTSSVEALQSDQKTEAEKDRIRMEGVDRILRMPASQAGKVALLVEEYQYTEETATVLVAPEGTANLDLEKLKSLSPLLANKLIDGMDPDRASKLLD